MEKIWINDKQFFLKPASLVLKQNRNCDRFMHSYCSWVNYEKLVFKNCESIFSTKSYIYIYIVIHRQTASFYQNSSVWLDTQDARSRNRNPSNFTIDKGFRPHNHKQTTLAKGIFRYFMFSKQQQLQPLFTFNHALSASRELNSFRKALHYANGGRQFLRQRAQPAWGSILW